MKMHHLAVGLALVGCDGTLPGESGNLTLSYTHGGLFESVSNPIGAGLKADVVIRDAETGEAAPISDAYSDDGGILAVSNIEGGTMDLAGISEGETVLNVDAEGILDTFPISVRAIGSVSYEDPTGAAEGGYSVAVGASLWIPRTVRDDSGDVLTGYGLALPTASTPGTLEGVEDGAIGSTLVRFDTAGEVGLVFAGESTGDSPEKLFTVVASDGVTWDVSDANEDPAISVGDVRAISVSGELDGGAVFGSIRTTEPVCVATALLGSAEVYTLTAVAEGICQVFLNGDDEPTLEYSVTAG